MTAVRMSLGICAVLVGCALASGCTSSGPVITGKQRPPIAATAVQIYSTPPMQYEQIAILTASSKSVFTAGGQKSVDKVVQRLKEQAAQLGANGLILEEFSDRVAGSIGTGVGSESYTHNGSIGVGVGGGVGIFKKTGKARAIFVPSPAP